MKTLSIFGIVAISILLLGVPSGSSTGEWQGNDASIWNRFAPDSLLPVGGGVMVRRADYRTPSPTTDLNLEGNCVPLIYNGDPSNKLDVVFVASHFYPEVGPGSDFAADVELFLNQFRTFPQFAANITKFNFYRLDVLDENDTCREVSGNPVCNRTKLVEMAQTCLGFDLGHNDQIVVLFDDETTNLICSRAESNVAYMSAGLGGVAWIIHEFGHSFGGLGDEYNNGSIATVDPPYPNCASATPGFTCSDKWGDLMDQNGVSCFPACGARNWYRPTNLDCVMNHPAVPHHCPVCFRHVDSLLTVYSSDVAVFVSSFVAVAFALRVELSWNIVADEGVMGFRLHRSTEGEEGDDVLVPPGLLGPSVRGYTDDGVHGGRTYHYTLAVELADRSEVVSHTVTVKTKAYVLELYQNSPNPFNPRTTISFTLPEKARVTLAIYDVQGRLVRMLVDEMVGEGYQDRIWDGNDASGNPVGSGVYFYRLTAGDKTLTKKMVLLK